MHISALARAALVLAAGALLLSGCGGESSTPPKQDLSEQDKQQIKELQEQRTQEWGPRKK
jgi:outer membrane biogenesis lipoprotein LolB